MIDHLELNSIRLSGKGKDNFFFFQPEGSGVGGARKPSEALWPLGTFARPFDAVIAADGQRGPAPTGLVFRSGAESYIMPMVDPRIHPLIPDPGLGGGGGAYAGWLASDGTARIAYSVFWGKGIPGHKEGSWTLEVPQTDAVDSPSFLIEIDRTNDRIRVTHPSGLYWEITSGKVTLGGTGASAIVIDNGALTAFSTAVVGALGALGKTVTMPSGYKALKAEAL